MRGKQLREMYSSYLANLISRGELVNRGSLSALAIKPLYNKIVTRKYIKKVIGILNIPTNYDESLTESLQDCVYSADKNSRVFINIYSIPTTIDVNSDQFKRQMSSSEDAYNNYRDMFSNLTGTEKSTGKNVFAGGIRRVNINKRELEKRQQVYESFEYVNSVVRNKGKLTNSYLFIEVVSPTDRTMNIVMKEVRDYLDTLGFNYKELSANSSSFMSNYSPACYIRQANSKDFNDILLSDENITALCPYKTQGFIGDGTGTLVGVNANSMTPFILNFFKTGDRQIVWLNAQSGYGKTMQAFIMALSFLGANIHCSALDVKGDEWIKMSAFSRYINIDISESSSTYINIYRLDDISLDTIDEANEFFKMSVTASINLINIICDTGDIQIDKKITEYARLATMKLFSINGVESRFPLTFKNSRNIKYSDLVTVLDDLKTSASIKKDAGIIDDMKKSLTDKFILSDTFKGREISLKDVIDTPLVIYSLKKNSDQSLTMDDKIRTFMISYLDMKKISIRKINKLGTVCFYEEMQRNKEFASLINFIAGVVTGARSSNVVVILLCNVISALVSKEMLPIASNISTFFIGPMPKKDLDLLEDVGCADLRSKLETMADSPENYKNYFAVKYDTGDEVGTTVSKCVIPEKVLDIMKTRDVIL